MVTHPLYQSEAGRRASELMRIGEGLRGDERDRGYWRDKAAAWIRALEEDGRIFGLVPHEARELDILKRLLASGGYLD